MKKTLLVFLFVCGMAGAAGACPMCKEVAANQSDPATAEHLRSGFALSLGLLLSTPYLLFGGITFLITRSARRGLGVRNAQPLPPTASRPLDGRKDAA